MGLSLSRILLIHLPGAWPGVLILGYPDILWAPAIANCLAVAATRFAAWQIGLLSLEPRRPTFRTACAPITPDAISIAE